MQELQNSITENILKIHNKSQLRIIYALTRTIIRENRPTFDTSMKQYPENSLNKTQRFFKEYDHLPQSKKMCLPFTSSSDTVIMTPDSCYIDDVHSESDSNFESISLDPSRHRMNIEESPDFCYLARPVTCFDAPELVAAKNLYMLNKFKK